MSSEREKLELWEIQWAMELAQGDSGEFDSNFAQSGTASSSHSLVAPHLGFVQPPQWGLPCGPRRTLPRTVADLAVRCPQWVGTPKALFPAGPYPTLPRSFLRPSGAQRPLAAPPTPWGAQWGGWRSQLCNNPDRLALDPPQRRPTLDH